MIEYTKSNQEINLIKDYIEDNAFVVSRDLGISVGKARDYVKMVINDYKDEGKFKDPIVGYNGKNQYGDTVPKEMKLTTYLENSKNGIIVPAGSVYTKHENQISVHTENTEERVKKRSIVKKEGAIAKLKGDQKMADMKDKYQKAYKAGNNAVTGLFDNMFNPFYRPSNHYALTSTTATVTTIGNLISESMVAGNRLYNRPNVVIDHITSLCTNSNIELVERVIKKYNIYIPTVDDCIYVILKSTRFHWSSKERDEEIFSILKLLTPIERAIFVYTNDLFHFRYYNDKLMRDIIDNIYFADSNSMLDPMIVSKDPKEDMKDIPEDLEIAVRCILYDDMLVHSKNKENVTFKDDLFMESKKKIATGCKRANNHLTRIDDLIEAFFRTDNLPINVSDIKEMIRGCTVLSDTDSTCSTYQNWVTWYFKKPLPTFTSDEIGISSIILLFTSRTLAHSLELLSKRMNIRGKYLKLLAMKNEFYWKVMIFMNMTKHYFADTAIQEGAVYAKTKLELKGSNLIDSKLPKDLKELSTSYYSKITDTLTSGAKINLHELIKEIVDIELDILNKIQNLDSTIMKSETILDHTSYKYEKDKSPYYHLMLWNEVFGPKYGTITTTPVVCIKVKTNMTTKARMMEGLNNIPDKDIRDRFLKFINKYPKDSLGVLRMPKEIVAGIGLPEELSHVMEAKPVVEELCGTFYFILESLGYYKKPNKILSELYYRDNKKGEE